ncbi:hypothetical protein ACSBL2_04180 [Pedobacter sp. AW31-3R]|uniref:hypothetical protein n=1 Tax=Pedobacter sp. AW31-3R TaxID=3445781 RepID=UPI003F9FB953
MKAFYLLVLLSLAGCEQKEIVAQDNAEKIEFKTLSLDNTSYRLKSNPDKTSETFIIKTPEEFGKHFEQYGTTSSIDLDNYFVLAGYTVISSCAKLRDQHLEATEKKLIYHVNIERLACSIIDTVTYAVLIPNAQSGKLIDFDVKMAN